MVSGHQADKAGLSHCAVNLTGGTLSVQERSLLTDGAQVLEVGIAEPASC